MSGPSSGNPPHQIAVDGTTVRFPQSADDTILRAALRAGLGMAYECNSGGCGNCRIQVVDGEVEDLWPDAPGRTARDRRTGRLLACQARARSDATIGAGLFDEYVPMVPPRRHRATLVDVGEVTHDMRRFVLHTDAPAAFAPGQYLSLSLPGVGAPRNYSMANTANDAGEWELIIRRVPGGRATGVLFDDLRVGADVEIDAPYGLATLRLDRPRDIVCVAGGSGLAPMLSIVRGAHAAGLLADRRVDVFYGARTPQDVCGRDELARLDGFDVTTRYHPVVSAPPDAHGQPWAGAVGLVHEVACSTSDGPLGGPLADKEWYCAGPPPMTQALQRTLAVDHAVPVDQIHFDRFF